MKKHAVFRHLFSFVLVFGLLFSVFVPYSCAVEDEDIVAKADLMFEEGQNLISDTSDPQNLVKGIALIIAAANLGSAKAMIQMGVMYSSGLGKLLSEDFVEGTEAELALSWYVKAADAGEKELAASAIASDAFSYFLGSDDSSIKEDDSVALTYFQKAAEYGDPSAINMMVAFYIYGFGVEADPFKALELEDRLASTGDVEALAAMEEYAYAFYSGNREGIDINFGIAFAYYEKLTEYNNERAMYNIGLLYEYGLGVSADHAKAIEWLTKAKAAGYRPAEAALAELSAKD